MLPKFSMWRTCKGEFTTKRASKPRIPLPLVANSVLCQVENDSNWVQPCQAVVTGHLWPLAFNLAAANVTSGHVWGSLSVETPAALSASRLTHMTVVELLKGKDIIWPLGAV